jgi:hypothetical protein
MTKPCAEKERSEAVQAAEGVTQRLEEMKLKIAKLSEGIIERIDHMGNRIDDLECTCGAGGGNRLGRRCCWAGSAR